MRPILIFVAIMTVCGCGLRKEKVSIAIEYRNIKLLKYQSFWDSIHIYDGIYNRYHDSAYMMLNKGYDYLGNNDFKNAQRMSDKAAKYNILMSKTHSRRDNFFDSLNKYR